ncbi:hypothetical protein DFH06DRAFT_1350565 [Mycena polygramma]|nr:hypothetical protein DFH06DRAFT_1350565 [Mycena polygramma]
MDYKTRVRACTLHTLSPWSDRNYPKKYLSPSMPRATVNRARSQRPAGTADNPLLVDENGRLVISLAIVIQALVALVDLATNLSLQQLFSPIGLREAVYDAPANPVYVLLTTERPHYECGICLHIKSHPVSYRCGHSHCMVCIRKWLELSWICPVCRKTMYEKPMPNDDIQRGIAFDHPEFVDTSRVDLSFTGLTFPTKSTIKYVTP